MVKHPVAEILIRGWSSSVSLGSVASVWWVDVVIRAWSVNRICGFGCQCGYRMINEHYAVGFECVNEIPNIEH